MITINVSLSSVQVARIMSFFTFLMLLPFLSTELSYLYNGDGACLVTGFSNLLLGQWLKDDAYIKLAICGFCILFIRMRRSFPQHNKLIVAAQGNLLTLYWIFQLAWSIAGGVMFWDGYADLGLCNQSFINFMGANLIFTYIFVPLGIFLSIMRPTFRIEEQTIANVKTVRGETQMSKYQN